MDDRKSLDQVAREALPSSFTIVPATGLRTAVYDPPAFVIEHLIPAQQPTLLGAHGGTGKSQLALILAAHCAAGRNWAGLQVQRCRAVFVSLEDPAALLLYRLKNIVDAYGLDPDKVEQGLLILDGSNGDAALAAESNVFGVHRIMPTASMEELAELAAGAGLIVIDNASDAFDGAENDRRQVRGFVRMLAQLARDNDAGVLLLAHIDKAAAKFGAVGNSYSGSTAWHNSARSRLALIQTEAGLELRQEKLNLGRKIKPIELAWSDRGVLIPSKAQPEGNQMADRDTQAAADDLLVLAALDAAATAGASVPIARSGPATTLALLQTFPELGKDFRGRAGKDRFWPAISRLHAAGKIVRDPYKDGYRKGKERWVRTAAPDDDKTECGSCGGCANPPIPPCELPRGTAARASCAGSDQKPGTAATAATAANDYRAAKDGTL